MGVIIKGDRITYAACIFPLTPRQDLSKTMGTRHRAAIGLTEENDSIAIVVSEQTGAISVVVDGQKFILRLIPSGILHRGKINVIGNGVAEFVAEFVGEIITNNEMIGFRWADIIDFHPHGF